jgi:hypothetical protein
METIKKFSLLVLFTFLYQIFFPTIAYALTGGPSQPEMESFEPVNTTEMVDLFSGDFTYNIPLLDVGGYPINISYHSGVTMDQEASWVGLGWNINPGVVNRNLRGLPDDFKGDELTKEFNIRENETWGVNIGAQLQLFGLKNLGLGINTGVFKNNYKGMGLSFGVSPSISAGQSGKGSLTGGLGLSFNTQEGANVSASLTATSKDKDNTSSSFRIGSGVNSRSGLKALTLDASVNKNRDVKSKKTDDKGNRLNKKEKKKDADGNEVDMKRSTNLASSSSSISFATPTFSPSMSMPFHNVSLSFEATGGGEIFGVHPNASISGFYSKQQLAKNKLKQPSYGYLFSQEGKDNKYALMDFNREKEVAYSPDVPNLAVPNYTFDLFSVSGQGVGGQFRAYRGDVGVLFDHQSTTSSESSDGGVELGGGNLVHGGFSITSTVIKTTTGKWTSDNALISKVDFLKTGPTPLYEKSFFKNVGEKAIIDESFQHKLSNQDLLRVAIFGRSAQALPAYEKFSENNSSLGGLSTNNGIYKSDRDKRQQLFSYLNTHEADIVGVDKSLLTYKKNKFEIDSTKSQTRFVHPLHHMSEITVLDPDGKRYVYGIPAYNNYQKQVTFNVGSALGNNDGLVFYDAGKDNTAENPHGKDRFYSADITPEYSHSFLLTGILSHDYVDLTNNGITEDDLGEAVRINYYKAHENYNWRVPIEKDHASFNEGFKSVLDDNKASYLYGRKQIWYTHSIESKTMVALFHLEKRDDAYGVKDENGERSDSDSLYLLKKIELFSKADLVKNQNNAIPVKTVHFNYDYSLCKGVPNQSNTAFGKLTLKEIYFTYGNNKGRINSYVFNYDNFNPDYHLKHYDRWGNYANNIAYNSNHPDNSEFPYVIQDKDTLDKWAQAWHLSKITLPSGGIINIEYESKDYAYVQNKRAMQMFFIKAFGSNENLPTAGSNDKLYISNNSHRYCFIQVPVPVYSKDDIERLYLEDVSHLYFKTLIDLDNKGSWEYVPGYAEIVSYGIAGGNNPNNDIIYLKLRDADGNNPIAKAAWQFMRLNLPDKAYPSSQNSGSVISLIKSLISVIGEIGTMIKGFDKKCTDNNWGKTVELSQSWVRLASPTYAKLGGGSRVKKIAINDVWDSMSPGLNNFEYGQEYSYKTEKVINGDTLMISSGVAAYEPMIGGEEIPQRNPLKYDIKTSLAPTNELYTETPLGESLYPAPVIGHSKVTVKNLSHPNVSITATGKKVHEFFTSYEFPTYTSYTEIKAEKDKSLPDLGKFSIKTHEYHTATQGAMVEVNDMHGKQKAISTYGEKGNLISSERHYYKVENENAVTKRLNNLIDIIRPNGSVGTATIGKDIDMWMDMRQQETVMNSFAMAINAESMIIPIFLPIFLLIPPCLPDVNTETTRFRSAMTVKYIQRFGILDRIERIVDGSETTNKNVLFDSETGEVLLTQATNEFRDTVYNFTYPAHWAYDNMSHAYKNIGTSFTSVALTNGKITGISNPELYFADGDEVLTGKFAMNMKAWVAKINHDFHLIDKYGKPIPYSSVNIKIIRSGRKNMQNIPVGTLTILKNIPLNQSKNKLEIHNADIIQASASEYQDKWKTECFKIPGQVCYTSFVKDTCLVKVLQAISDTINAGGPNYLFATASQGITLDSIVTLEQCNPDYMNFPFFVTNPNLQHFTPYSAQMGHFTLTITSTIGQQLNLDSAFLQIVETEDCYEIRFPDFTAIACITETQCVDVCQDQISTRDTINPYYLNLANNWKKKNEWVYYSHRVPDPTASTENRIQKHGAFSTFNEFWKYDAISKIFDNNSAVDQNWTQKNEITLINRRGIEVEDKNAIDIYSSAVYGYLGTLPKAMANNAMQKNIGYDGFEDYDFKLSSGNPCYSEHWDFKGVILESEGASITNEYAHTGNYSLKINAGSSITVASAADTETGEEPYFSVVDNSHFQMEKGCLSKFSPDSGKYIFSAWVREDTACNPITYVNDSIKINVTNDYGSFDFVLYPEGKIIEGWQRYEGVFNINYPGTTLSISLYAKDVDCYFDDLRIHPFNSNMKSFVFDDRSLRLMAELDENNFATFYEYDDSGILIRVKKETDRGIMTIKESRSKNVRK